MNRLYLIILITIFSTSVNLPLRGFKHSVYEGGLRVPFLISWPYKFKNSINDEPIISIDIMPTICAALDIDLPNDRIFDGKNILSAISGKLANPLHQALYYDGNDNAWAVRDGN